VAVTRFEAPRHLAFDWSGGIHVEMSFESFAEDATLADVMVSGLSGPDVLAQATGTVEGFAIVLCDLKTLLETGESAHLVRDKAEVMSRKSAVREQG